MRACSKFLNPMFFLQKRKVTVYQNLFSKNLALFSLISLLRRQLSLERSETPLGAGRSLKILKLG
jgi:hypothetical protein